MQVNQPQGGSAEASTNTAEKSVCQHQTLIGTRGTKGRPDRVQCADCGQSMRAETTYIPAER